MLMTNTYPSPELEAAAKRSSYRDKLAEASDEELIRIYRTAEEKFSNKRLKWHLLNCYPEEFYQGAAAVDVLRERYGNQFIERLTGVHQPKTLIQKIFHYIFG